jgi:hypothetical protein
LTTRTGVDPLLTIALLMMLFWPVVVATPFDVRLAMAWLELKCR